MRYLYDDACSSGCSGPNILCESSAKPRQIYQNSKIQENHRPTHHPKGGAVDEAMQASMSWRLFPGQALLPGHQAGHEGTTTTSRARALVVTLGDLPSSPARRNYTFHIVSYQGSHPVSLDTQVIGRPSDPRRNRIARSPVAKLDLIKLVKVFRTMERSFLSERRGCVCPWRPVRGDVDGSMSRCAKARLGGGNAWDISPHLKTYSFWDLPGHPVVTKSRNNMLKTRRGCPPTQVNVSKTTRKNCEAMNFHSSASHQCH